MKELLRSFGIFDAASGAPDAAIGNLISMIIVCNRLHNTQQKNCNTTDVNLDKPACLLKF